MPLETFNFLDSLNASNPPVSDGVAQGDDHLRGIKLTLKNTFPNVTGAVTATQGAINASAAWTTAGVNLLNHSGVFFDNGSGVASTDGFQNTLAGDIDFVLQGSVAATFRQTVGVNTLIVAGGIQATGEIKGPGITPLGAGVMWFDDTLPTDGLWVWANGQVIANANTVAPILLARWGSKYGGNGTTTMGVPDMREVVPVGKSTMGATTARGLLTSITTSLLTTIASVFGAQQVTIQRSDLPNVAPAFHGSAGTVTASGAITASQNGGTFNTGTAGNPCTYSPNQTIAVNVSGTFTPAGTIDSLNGGVAQTNLNNVQPSATVNWIIRIG